MGFQINTTRVSDQITLYQRTDHNTKHWQMRIMLKNDDQKNQYLVMSTKRQDLEEAKKAAYKKLIEKEVLQERGISVFGRKVKYAWVEWVKEELYEVGVGKISAKRQQAKESMTRRWFRHYFADKAIHTISDEDMKNYWKWRINYADSDEAKTAIKSDGARWFAKKPKDITLHEEGGVIKQIFMFALTRRYIKHEEIPNHRPPVNKTTADRRFPFEDDEMKLIFAAINKTIKDNQHNKIREFAWKRLQTKVYIMRHTGMRAAEAMNLKWGDYKHRLSAKDDRTFTDVFVHGKGKYRTLTAIYRVGKWLDDFKKWLNEYMDDPHTKDDDYVFHVMSGKQSGKDNYLFTDMLKELGIFKDKMGGNRVLGCLRHTYATNRILDGDVRWELLEMQMGTSAKMLKNHYADVVPQQKSAEITFSSQYQLEKEKREERKQKKNIADAGNVIEIDTRN